MPSTSIAQQRLMGMAYAYKKGELSSSEVSDEVKELADGMTLKQLKDFASTKHAGLPETVDEALQEYEKNIKIMKHVKTFESFSSVVNEEYIELPSLDVPSTDLIEAFKEWYKATADNWEDFKNDMSEDSVDEAAKNAQMEILAYLSNEMNNIIRDRKFKVRMDLK